MQSAQILYPIFAMVLITVVLGFNMLRLRFRAVRQDGLHAGYFLYNRGAKPPEYLLRSEQHFTNLFETPMLFYVVVILAYVTQHTDAINITLAWLFVASRLLHAWQHLGYNTLTWRRRTFLATIIILIVFWSRLFIQLITQ
ncbi:MAG: MAPEG family protein [Gammaproteobacteria bacterium]|nr:MAPEG family protein [Gammaproteobacteria bacterium]MDH5650768.1 MAPEG family protein [Gammaproteobacteria bacterium]